MRVSVTGAKGKLTEMVRKAEAGEEVILTRHGHAVARRVARAYARWGKGTHPAGLNFGDCFAYEVAIEHGCRLLYVGADFDRTDVARVLEGG